MFTLHIYCFYVFNWASFYLNIFLFVMYSHSDPIRTIFGCNVKFYFHFRFTGLSSRPIFHQYDTLDILPLPYKEFPVSIRNFHLDESNCLPKRKYTNISIVYKDVFYFL
jgi:hypothetical protein